METMSSMEKTQAKNGKLSGKGLKVILFQCVRNISMFGYQVKGETKGQRRVKDIC